MPWLACHGRCGLLLPLGFKKSIHWRIHGAHWVEPFVVVFVLGPIILVTCGDGIYMAITFSNGCLWQWMAKKHMGGLVLASLGILWYFLELVFMALTAFMAFIAFMAFMAVLALLWA